MKSSMNTSVQELLINLKKPMKKFMMKLKIIKNLKIYKPTLFLQKILKNIMKKENKLKKA